MNDRIQPHLHSLYYTTLESVAAAAQQLGKGVLLAKLDIKSAYRLVPVHQHDRQLLEGGQLHRWGTATWPQVGPQDLSLLQWPMPCSGSCSRTWSQWSTITWTILLPWAHQTQQCGIRTWSVSWLVARNSEYPWQQICWRGPRAAYHFFVSK